MILSDTEIRQSLIFREIEIEPFDESCVQPSSYDVHVSHEFRVFRNNSMGFIDTRVDNSNLTELIIVQDDVPMMLHPGEFVLASTVEFVKLPDNIVARLEGKSSLGRLGLMIHSTAGFIDAGFYGQVTLELSNVANLPITVYPGMAIGQLSFMRMTGRASRPYGHPDRNSKYQGQDGPTGSLYHLNYDATPEA